MKILITGVNGFLGRPLSVALQQLGHDVIGFDRSMSAIFPAGIELVQGDLVSRDGFDKVCWDQLDAVYHLASMGVKPESRQWPICTEVNIQGTLNVLQAINESKCTPKLIYTRSFYEEALAHAPALRENPYIVTKSIASALVDEFSTRYDGVVVAIKLFQIYGPGDANTTVLPYVCHQFMNEEIAVLGSGLGLRDWIFVDDVIAGLVAALSSGQEGHMSSYDLGTGELTSLRDMAESLATLFNMSDQLFFDPAKDRSDTELVSHAKDFMRGWKCRMSRHEGLKALMESYRQERDLI